jgi:RNA polymerase sigma-70 factor, ECF subfamily
MAIPPNPDPVPGVYISEPPGVAPRVHEPELIDRALAGEMTAARQLYDAHVGAVFRLALRLTADEQLAHDATQDTFVRCFRALRGFRGDSSLKTWIHTIALSSIRNVLRSRKRWQQRFTDMEFVENTSDGRRETDPDLRDRLYAAIDALPDIYRAVFVLHEIEGHNHEEIGALLHIPSGTSKARLSEARAKLRTALKAFEGGWASA